MVGGVNSTGDVLKDTSPAKDTIGVDSTQGFRALVWRDRPRKLSGMTPTAWGDDGIQ